LPARGVSAVRLSVFVLLDDESNPLSSRTIAYRGGLCAAMGVLEHSIEVLKLLTPVLDMVPVIGSNLKGAAELASEICEIVKV
jgi:hypothetical protein